MELETRITRIGEQINQVVSNLARLGYIFERPASVWPGPADNVDEIIREIEKHVGKLPKALTFFWSTFGSVDLSCAHQDWTGCDYPDPLIVFPASVALEELQDFLEDSEDRLAADVPFVIPIAPDFYHKADVSGGMFYNISLPADSENPMLNDEPHRLPFIDYMEYALGWGGFPGLEVTLNHTWPLDQIRSEL